LAIAQNGTEQVNENWVYAENIDSSTGAAEGFILSFEVDPEEGRSMAEQTLGALLFGCGDGELLLTFHAGVPLDTDDFLPLVYQIDGNEEQSVTWPSPLGGGALAPESFVPTFVEELKAAEQLTLTTATSPGSELTYTFRVAGIDEALSRLPCSEINFIADEGAFSGTGEAEVTYLIRVRPEDCTASVTYSTGDGDSRQIADAENNWEHTFEASPDDFLFLSAQNQCDTGSVTTKILVNGETFKTVTSEGGYVVASVSGSYGEEAP